MQLDNKRGNYLLNETSLAKTLCLACRFDPKTPSGQAAIKYKEGRNAGFFAKTMREVRQAFVGLQSVKGVHSLGCDSRGLSCSLVGKYCKLQTRTHVCSHG